MCAARAIPVRISASKTTQSASTSLPAAALELAALGFRVFPVAPRGKKPLIKQWQRAATTDPEQVAHWWQKMPNANIGLATGKESGLFVLDRDGPAGNRSYAKLCCRELEATLQVRTGKGVHHYVLWPDDGTEIRNSAGRIAEGIDVRGEGGYVVAPPSVHPSGAVYKWLNWPAELLPWTLPKPNGHAATLAAAASEALEEEGGRQEPIPEGQRNDALTAEAGAMRARGLSTEVIKVALHAIDQELCNPPLDAAEVDAIASSVGAYAPQAGAPVLKFSNMGVLTETDLGAMFVAQHPDLRYVDKESRWYVYNGTYWAEDDILCAWNLARKFAVQVGATRSQGRGRIQSVRTINAVVKVAEAHESVATRVEDLDTQLHLLNTPAGTYDLDGGKMLPHQPEHLITRITAVAPDPRMKIPLFRSHLKLVTGGDSQYIEFLQRMAGYLLTGEINMDAFFFLYGTGGNGKGTLMDNLAGPLGIKGLQASSYARTAPPEVFMKTVHPQHPEALARLRGARLVMTPEVPDGQWNENLLKMVTGGGMISARYMRANSFEYAPQFKLVITGNKQPTLRSVDFAIRRRFLMLPFAVNIAKELGGKLDPEMREHKLRREWPGILHWMIEGYGMFKRDGLAPPAQVTRATDAYLEREDALGNWISEKCDTGSDGYRAGLGELYVDYQTWCTANGERWAETKRRFRTELENRETLRCEIDAHTKTPVFYGIRLKAALQPNYTGKKA